MVVQVPEKEKLGSPEPPFSLSLQPRAGGYTAAGRQSFRLKPSQLSLVSFESKEELAACQKRNPSSLQIHERNVFKSSCYCQEYQKFGRLHIKVKIYGRNLAWEILFLRAVARRKKSICFANEEQRKLLAYFSLFSLDNTYLCSFGKDCKI